MNCHSCMNASNCQVEPIVMPTKVQYQNTVSFCEQPIIYPIECRPVHRVILVPRVYMAYANQCQNMRNCQ